MKTIVISSIAAAVIASMPIPVLAQMSSSSSGAMSNSSSMSSDSKPMTCQGMMDKESGMALPSNENKKSMAMKEMDMAKTAMAKGDEKTCMSHMKMAMHDVM